MCAGATVYAALRHAGMTSGQRIGVVGVGGLGAAFVRQSLPRGAGDQNGEQGLPGGSVMSAAKRGSSFP